MSQDIVMYVDLLLLPFNNRQPRETYLTNGASVFMLKRRVLCNLAGYDGERYTNVGQTNDIGVVLVALDVSVDMITYIHMLCGAPSLVVFLLAFPVMYRMQHGKPICRHACAFHASFAAFDVECCLCVAQLRPTRVLCAGPFVWLFSRGIFPYAVAMRVFGVFDDISCYCAPPLYSGCG